MKQHSMLLRKMTVLTALLNLAAVPALAAGGADAGRELTKARCKGCHIEGSKAGTMTPLSRTQRQWERFFEKAQHEKKAPGSLQQINPKELEQIRRYLIDHAADSPQPETCG